MEQRKFEVGQAVRVIDQESPWAGREGRVSSLLVDMVEVVFVERGLDHSRYMAAGQLAPAPGFTVLVGTVGGGFVSEFEPSYARARDAVAFARQFQCERGNTAIMVRDDSTGTLEVIAVWGSK